MNNHEIKTDTSGKEYIFEIIGYILTSAEMVTSGRGPSFYSALRFIEVAERLINIYKYVDCLEEDPYLIKINEKLNKIKLNIRALGGEGKREDFENNLKKLLIDVATEKLRRIEEKSVDQ
jgi:hypothetical protein